MTIQTIPLPSILEDGVPDIAFSPEILRFMNNSLYTDGLIPNITDNLKTTITTGLGVSVSAGGALVNGTFVKSDSTTALSITQGEASTRIDLIVVERDYLNRTSTIKVVEGVAGGGVPSLTQNDGGVWQFELSKLTIPAGTLSLTSDMIENTALDFYAEDLQAIHKDKATNCILEAPTLMSNVGGTLTVPIGYKVLIPVGTKTDGTIDNIEHEVLSAITYSLPSVDGTYYIFIDKEDTITVSTSYNQQTNKAVIGKVVVASSVPTLTAYKPLEVLHTSNICERIEEQKNFAVMATSWIPPDTSTAVNVLSTSVQTADKNMWLYVNYYAQDDTTGATIKIGTTNPPTQEVFRAVINGASINISSWIFVAKGYYYQYSGRNLTIMTKFYCIGNK